MYTHTFTHIQFAQHDDSAGMFVVFFTLLGTAVYFSYSYFARQVFVRLCMKIFGLVMVGQILALSSLLISSRPLERFKKLFDIEHRKET